MKLTSVFPKPLHNFSHNHFYLSSTSPIHDPRSAVNILIYDAFTRSHSLDKHAPNSPNSQSKRSEAFTNLLSRLRLPYQYSTMHL